MDEKFGYHHSDRVYHRLGGDYHRLAALYHHLDNVYHCSTNTRANLSLSKAFGATAAICGRNMIPRNYNRGNTPLVSTCQLAPNAFQQSTRTFDESYD
ncbi:hypothetical protein [Sporosarcina koreensis]|uniref:Uncharacterized protein n=1 Tax=Sporosarcina koreensis TaxID=334735 RepID=A0ABW0U3E1_9BACL